MGSLQNLGSKGCARSGALVAFANAWNAGTKPQTSFAGLQGRFIRMAPGMADSLTDDPDRRIVFLVDAQTCCNMIGLSGYQIASACGWDANYTRGKVEAGYRFAFVVFPETDCKLGTWDNVLDEVVALYPEIGTKINQHRASLRKMVPSDLAHMEARLGYKFIDIDAGKYVKTAANPKADPKSDPRFMTIARYQAAPNTVESARAFLYHVVHLKDLFYGDGWTRNNAGQRGVEEYIMGARAMNDLGEHFIAPITVNLPNASTGTKARGLSRGELPLPDFYEPANAALWSYQPRLQGAIPGQTGLFEAATKWRKQHGIKPAGAGGPNVNLLIIDPQNDFTHPDGTLFVAGRSGNGAIADCARTAEHIYANLSTYTTITATMDTHFAHQIFFASFWEDQHGNPIGAHRVITTAQIDAGEVRPTMAMASWLCGGNYAWLLKQVRHYTSALESAGKYALYIWPPHCVLGSQGHALNGVVFEAMMFHGFARIAQPGFEVKGGHPLTENYSVLKPEVLTRHDGKPLAQKNTTFIKTLLASDALVIAGQAASHCVKSSIDDILAEITATDPKLAGRVYIMRDCTSAVVVPGGMDFTEQADAAFDAFSAAGMHVVDSTTPMRDWPGMPSL